MVKSSSFVWKFFTKESKDDSGRQFATCLKCRKTYKLSGNTSNMRDHLKRAHHITNDNVKTRSSNSSDDSETLVDPDGSTSTPAKKLKQEKIKKFASKCIQDQYQDDDRRKKELDLHLTLMIATDLQPFNIVNDFGFRKFCEKMDPRYKLPSTTTIKRKLLPDLLEALKKKLTEILREVDAVALTTDIWTCSFTTLSYMTVTVHFILEYELYSCVLETKHLEDSHTGENLSRTIEEILGKWNLKPKVTCIVSDNASNMKNTCNILNVPHIGCFAHTINLVVEDGLKNTRGLQEIIGKCKSIVTHFKRSAKATDILRKEQEKRNEKQLKLLQDIVTRWNSIYYMMKRILEIGDTLTLTLLNQQEGPDILNNNERTILCEVVKILEPFENATQQISGNYVTISLMIPIIKGIYHNLNKSKDELKTSVARDLCENLINSADKRLSYYEKMSIPSLGTILDPRFKKEGFRSTENALRVHAQIQKMAQALIKMSSDIEENVISSSNEPGPSSKPSAQSDENFKKIESLFSFLDKSTNILKSNSSSKAIICVRQYMESETIKLTENPLEYWKKSNDDILKKLVFKYMCVPATSVPSERLFSKAGLTLSAKRSRLSAKNIDSILFVTIITIACYTSDQRFFK